MPINTGWSNALRVTHDTIGKKSKTVIFNQGVIIQPDGMRIIAVPNASGATCSIRGKIGCSVNALVIKLPMTCINYHNKLLNLQQTN